MSEPPVRLLDQAEIEPELKQALGELGGLKVPFDVSAGAAQLKEAIGNAPPAAPEPSWLLKHKLWLLAGGGAALIGGAALVATSSKSTPPAPPPVTAPVVVAPPAPVVEKTEAPEPAPAPSVEKAPPPPASASAKPQATKPTLAEEVRHLGEVRALAGTDPAGAARKADEGHKRFAGGMLYQEREAVAITSLARAGRGGEARARASRFLAQFPKSPFADQVRAAAP